MSIRVFPRESFGLPAGSDSYVLYSDHLMAIQSKVREIMRLKKMVLTMRHDPRLIGARPIGTEIYNPKKKTVAFKRSPKPAPDAQKEKP